MGLRHALAVAATVLVVAPAAACGGGGGAGAGGEDLDATLRYLPADTAGVVVVSTDVESDQFRELDRIVRARTRRGIEEWLRKEIEEDSELSYDTDVRPLLGHEVVASMSLARELVVVFRSADADRLRQVVERQKTVRSLGEIDGARLYEDTESDSFLAVDGDVLLAADDESTLRRALEQRERDDRLTEDEFRSRLGDVPQDALFRGYGDVAPLLAFPQVGRLRAVPWVSALRSVGGALSFRDRRAILDLVFNTDPDRLADRDLPLATGDDPPEVLDRTGEVVGGNRNQSLTTVFLWRLAEAALPDSRFVRDVHDLERELGIDFADEILRQFDGPSASAVSPDGEEFAARSKVHDPERLRDEIRELAPRLPRIVQALAPLRSEGQALLFLFAPDAIVLQSERVRVFPPKGPNGLYHVVGLTGEGPDELYFGVLDDVFVVASDEAAARKVAREPTHGLDATHGAAVFRVDLTGQEGELRDRVGVDPGRVGEVVGWVEAARERLRAQVRVEFK